MISDIYENGAYTLKKGEIAVLEGSETVSLNLLLQGKLDFYISPSYASELAAERLTLIR